LIYLDNFSTKKLTQFVLADDIMDRLPNDPEQRCSVDWLTEVVRRLSEASLDGSMQTVKITPTRFEKVCSVGIHLLSFLIVW
jgi:hypothetical protein